MKRILLIIFAIHYSLFHINCEAQESLTNFVDPFIGTGGHGHTYPGALLPFGMVQLSLDTRLDGWDGCSGYHFSDSVIYGFSHTHLSGTGCSDFGDILFMPIVGNISFNNGSNGQNGYSSKLKKANEKAYAGYYKVKLENGNISAELTATLHTGIHRYIFPKSKASSTIGVKKSVVLIIQFPSSKSYTAASSLVSLPTNKFLKTISCLQPLKISSSTAGAILQPQPEALLNCVSFTDIFNLMYL